MNIKSSVFLLTVAGTLSLQAVEFTVNPMPISPFGDTEVSTNMAINRADISYADLHFAFDGTPTNSLELAFGTDWNTNGVLEAEEVETRFGWCSGRYFIENARTCERVDSEVIAGSQDISVELHLDIKSSPQQVRRVAVGGASAVAFAGVLSDSPPSWLWRREWNLMRATRRGTEPHPSSDIASQCSPCSGDMSDWIYYKTANFGFTIRMR